MLHSPESLKKNFITFISLLFLSLILYIVDHQGIISPVKSILASPFLVLEKPLFSQSQAITRFWAFVIDWPIRENEMRDLRSQLIDISLDKNELVTCFEENNHLKKLLGANLPPRWQFLEVNIIGNINGLRIDRGQEDGIQEGMNVLYEDILIGKINRIEPKYAYLTLINQTDLKVPVRVRSAKKEARAKGILIGGGGNNFLIDKVLQEEELVKDDLVVTDGGEGWLPDLLIGRIDEVVDNKTELYQKASVLPLADFEQLDTLFVIVNN